jgi:1,2-diacylglycerol 3-alpha-glucosyltransferase
MEVSIARHLDGIDEALYAGGRRAKVAVIYHFFPHYRGPVIEELRQSPACEYYFCGDVSDPDKSGIRAYDFSGADDFVRCKSITIGRLIFQVGLVKALVSAGIDAVVFWGDIEFSSAWFVAPICRFLGKRTLFWTHGWTREQEPRWKAFIRKAFFKIPHALLLYGRRSRQIAMNNSFNPTNLYVLFNSLARDKQEKLSNQVTETEIEGKRVELFGTSSIPVLICTSRLIKTRRLDLLLEAAVELKRNGSIVNILLVGDGPEKEALRLLASEKELTVCFYGECYDEKELALLIKASTVTVSPGAIGLAAIHSLVYGTPVVTHSDPSIQFPEWEAIVPGVNGTLYTLGDSVDLAKAISTWLRPTLPTEENRQAISRTLDWRFHPAYQRRVLDAAILGVPATTLQRDL